MIVNEMQTSADPVVFWLRACLFCFLDGRAPQSGEIMGLLKLEDYMPAALADSLKADEEDRMSGHAPLVAVTENEEVATHSFIHAMSHPLLHATLNTSSPSLSSTSLVLLSSSSPNPDLLSTYSSFHCEDQRQDRL